MGVKAENNYLTGKLLIAAPTMGDPRFHRAVIFVCSHDENGAMGLVINNAVTNVEFGDLLEQLKIESDIQINLKEPCYTVLCGGPVETARGFLLHSPDFKRPYTMPLEAGFGLTSTVDALKDVALGHGPEHMLFALGYAGWGPRQLDEEIQENSWLIVDSDPNIVFNKDHTSKWQMAIQKLGIDVGRLSSLAGKA